jgi:hypothetical protein
LNIYIPYTYLIGWSKHNTFYYGRRTAKNCHPNEFWIKYFTSSKDVKNFRNNNGDPDIIQIRKTFPGNPDACKLWESKVLEKLDAQHDSRFLNKKNGDHKWDTTGQIPWNKGIPCTDKTKQKISKSNTGKTLGPQSPETCLKKSIANKGQVPWHKGKKGVYSENSLQKIRDSKKGKHRPKSVCDALSASKKGKVCCIDIVTGAKLLIEADEFNSGKGVRYFGVASKKGKELLSRETI